MNPAAGHGTTPPETAVADEASSLSLRELPEALILGFDAQLRFSFAAGQALDRLGGPPAYGPGQPLEQAFPEELWSVLEPLLRSALEGETRTREIWAGEDRCLAVDVGPMPMPEGVEGTQGGVAVLIDATARRYADLATARDGFEEIFERAPVGTGLLDLEGRWLLVNRALCEITGYTSDELIGKRFDGIIHPDDAYALLAGRERLLANEAPALALEMRYFDASGETVAALLSMSLVRDGDGSPLHFIAQAQDISERKALEEQLRRLGDHDPLTGLRNRRLFLHDLHLQVARSRRYGEVAGLMVIDIEDMRRLNDERGRDAGDSTLKAVARALMRRLRQTDLIARVGGDEFAVLLPHIDAEGLAVVAENLERVIPACSVDVGDAVVHPEAFVGFTLIDERTADAQQALTAAARSMRGVSQRP